MTSELTQFLTDCEGREVAVVQPVEDYEELLEDLQDLAVIAERRDEPRLDWHDVIRRLEADGLIHA
jgi:hypothetical protein